MRKTCLWLIIVVNLLLYANTFDNGFSNWDDELYIHENPRVHSLNLSHVFKLFNPNGVIESGFVEFFPLRDLSYAVDYAIFGLNPVGYHFQNLLFHVLCAVLVFFLCARLVENPYAALLGALFFSCHPAQVEAITWISGRKNGMFLFFELSAFLCFLKSTDLKSKNRSLMFILSWLCLLAGLLSKAMTITLVPLLLLYIICLKPNAWKLIKQNFLKLLILFTTTLLFFGLFVLIAKSQDVIHRHYGMSWLHHFALLPITLLSYLKLIVFPFNLNPRYDIAAPLTFSEPRFLFASAMIVSLSILFALYLRRSRLAWLMLFWVLISLLPVLNILPFPIVVAERFLYLPLVGISFGIAIMAQHVFNGRLKYAKQQLILLLSVLLVLGLKTIWQNDVWQTAETLWTTVMEKSPQFEGSYINLGVIAKNNSRREDARLLFNKALSVDYQHSALALYNLAVMDWEDGDKRLALKKNIEAVFLDPKEQIIQKGLEAVYLSNRDPRYLHWQNANPSSFLPSELEQVRKQAAHYMALFLFLKARTLIEKGLTKWPSDFDLRYQYLQLLSLMHDPDKAIFQGQMILKFYPNHLGTLRLLAQNHLAKEEFSQSESLFQRLFEIDASQPATVVSSYALLLLKMTSYARAQALFTELIKRQPDTLSHHLNRLTCAVAQGVSRNQLDSDLMVLKQRFPHELEMIEKFEKTLSR